MTTIRKALQVVLCVLVLVAAVRVVPLVAAGPARDLGAMQVSVDMLVYVRLTDGVELRGLFVKASSQELVIVSASGERTLAADRVMYVWKPGDRLRNGAIIGGILGLLGGIFGQSECTDCSGEIALGVGVGVPLWAGIGALIDRAHEGRTLIYERP